MQSGGEQSDSDWRRNSGGELGRVAAQEMVVDKFASLLGFNRHGDESRESIGTTGTAGKSRPETTAAEFSQFISQTAVGHHDVVCTIPSLHIGAAASSSDPLPRLGETCNEQNTGEKTIPKMEASVLPSGPPAGSIETQSAALNLSESTSWTWSNLVQAPRSVANNLGESFNSLLDSRTKEWTMLLLRRSLSTGDVRSRSVLLRMLSSKFEINRVTTSFKTLPLPESARTEPMEEYDVILPLLFEAVVCLCIHGQSDETVTFGAAGTISGNFAKEDLSPTQSGLTKIDIRLNTKPLLDSLVKEARIMVAKLIENATQDIEKEHEEEQSSLLNKTETPQEKEREPAPYTLSQFSSVLKLSSHPASPDEPPSLRKARSSALRLNEVLQGHKPTTPTMTKDQLLGTPLSKSRKNRSVTWNHPLEPPKKDSANLPAGKKPRVQPGARIKSFKSFGRPHADDTPGRQENATFAEFGRPTVSIWGRDGRMRHHPKPQGANSTWQTDDNLGASTKNASFDLQRPQLTSLHGLTRNRNNERSSKAAPEASLPRNATAMETWLLNSSKIGKPPNS